jgi:hypothetical protein
MFEINIFDVEHIFKIYEFFGVAKIYPCYLTKISEIAKIPLSDCMKTYT